MPDPRSAMQEFRSLESKRALEGLTPGEERRLAELRELLGPEVQPPAPRAGFDVGAAAARLRESLRPAGTGGRGETEPPFAPPAQAPAAAAAHEEPAPEPLAPGAPAEEGGLDEQALLQVEQALSGLEAEPAWGAGEGYDPAATPYDPNAPAAYDPNAYYDPNAADPADPQAWDQAAYATQPYDPAAADPGAAPYDPNAPYDPSAYYDPNAPQPADGQVWDPAAYATQPYDPAAADPGAAPYDPNAPYDPSAYYDPNAPQPADGQAWDPAAYATQPYDPAAAGDPGAAPYDPNAYYDPNAPQPADGQAWDQAAYAEPPHDPAAAGDPGAAPYDPNAYYDPNTPQPADAQAWDQATYAAQPHDPAAAGDPGAASDDPNAPYPSAEPGLEDPYAQPRAAADPYAAAPPPEPAAVLDEGDFIELPPEDAETGIELDSRVGGFAAPAEPAEAEGWDVTPPRGVPADVSFLALEGDPAAEPAAPFAAGDAAGLAPEGWEPAPAPPSAPPDAPLGEYDETGGAPVLGEPAELDALPSLELDTGEAGAPAPSPASPALGEYDDTAGFTGSAFEAVAAEAPAPEVAPEAGTGWEQELSLDVEPDFRQESGGSFEAAADAAVPEWATPGDGSGWGAEAEPTGAAPGEPPPAELQAYTPAEPGEPVGAPELALGEDAGAELPSEGGAPPLEGAPEHAAYAPAGWEVGADPDAYPSAGGWLAEAEPDAAAFPGLAAEPELGASDAGGDPYAPGAELEPHALGGADLELAAGAADVADAGLPAADLYLAPPAEEAPAPASLDSAPAVAEPYAEETLETIPLDELPTLEDDDLLEEIPVEELIPLPLDEPEPVAAEAPEVSAPPPAAALLDALDSAPPAPPEAAPTTRLPGSHRVVVHTVDGQALRGVLEDPVLLADDLALIPQAGATPAPVPTGKVKAIFFMLSPGEPAPAPEGARVRVTFRDGRQVAGFSPDYREGCAGFSVIPADSRTNTARIWVYQPAVKQVTVG